MPDVNFIALAANGVEPRKRIQVAKLGRFKDPRYGTFHITAADVESWKRNLEQHFGGEVPMDKDHATDKGTSSEAHGWIRNLALEGDKVMADVEWTPVGEQLVREKRYRYISPTFVSDRKDQTGKSLGPTLLRAALTNNPFLHDMPAVSLDAGPLTAEPDTSPSPGPDTRPTMSNFAPIALALGLDKDADEATILAAVELANKKTEPETTPKTLEAQAADEGKVLLDATEHDQLKTNAAKAGALEARVVTLETEAAEEKFTLAFDAAFDQGKVDAKPETRELHKGIYDKDPASYVKLLESLPTVVNLAGGSRRDQQPGDAPAGVTAESHELNAKVEAYMLEHTDLDYPTALDRVLATQGA